MLLLIFLDLIIIFIIIFSNVNNGYRIDQWTNDCRTIKMWINASTNSDNYKKDYCFPQMTRITYIPLPFWIIRKIYSKIGSLEITSIIIHTIFSSLCIFIWSLFTYSIYHSCIAAFEFTLLTIPSVRLRTGDTTGVGVPGHWSPRYWGNAIMPVFLFLIYLSGKENLYIIPAFLVSSFIFNIHPVSGIISFIILCVQCLHMVVFQTIYLFSIIPLFVFYFFLVSFAYKKITNSEDRYDIKLSEEDHKIYNSYIRSRWPLWPDKGSIFDPFLNKMTDSFIALFYIMLSVLLTGYYILNQQYTDLFHLQTVLNILLMLFLIDKFEPFGYMLIFLSSLSVFTIPVFLTPILAVFFMITAVIYRYKRYYYQWYFLGGNIGILVFAFILSGGFREGVITPLEMVLQWSFSLIFIAYTLCGAVFHHILPVMFNQKYRFLEITRILKGAFYPVYYLSFLAICQLLEIHNQPGIVVRISIWAILLSIAYCVWVYFDHFETSTLDHENFIVMNWIRENTPEGACFHTISYEKPLFGEVKPVTSTLPFWIRTIGERAVTFSYKDSPLKPEYALRWYRRKLEISNTIVHGSIKDYFEQAIKYGADYLLVSNHLIEGYQEFRGERVKVFDKLSIFKTG